MGGQFSAELSDGRELAMVFLETFGREYEKLYSLEMVEYVREKSVKDDAQHNRSGSRWKLYRAPYRPPPLRIRDEVEVSKRSKHLKRWNSRYLVLRGNHLIDYYDSPEHFRANKPPLGTINMSNRLLSPNANEAEQRRREQLAHAFSLSLTEIPRHEALPDRTVELYHRRAAPVLLQLPSASHHHSWCELLERAHWLAPRLSIDDPVHLRAYSEALRRTRLLCGLADTAEFGGGETAALEDAIIELIDARVLPKVDLRQTGSWHQRKKARADFKEKSGELVTKYVFGKWHLIYGKTGAKRGTVQSIVREYFGHIDECGAGMRAEISQFTRKATEEFLTASVAPHLSEIAARVQRQLAPVYAKLPALFDACVVKGQVKYEVRGDRMFLATEYSGSEECYEQERALWAIRRTVALVSDAFNRRVYEWFVLEHSVLFYLQCVIVNALFTFEVLFERHKSYRSWDDTAREVRGLVEEDAKTAGPRALGRLLYHTALCYFTDEYIAPSLTQLKLSMITPLENRIPPELRQFVNAQELVVQVMRGDLLDLCRRIAAEVFEVASSATSPKNATSSLVPAVATVPAQSGLPSTDTRAKRRPPPKR